MDTDRFVIPRFTPDEFAHNLRLFFTTFIFTSVALFFYIQKPSATSLAVLLFFGGLSIFGLVGFLREKGDLLVIDRNGFSLPPQQLLNVPWSDVLDVTELCDTGDPEWKDEDYKFKHFKITLRKTPEYLSKIQLMTDEGNPYVSILYEKWFGEVGRLLKKYVSSDRYHSLKESRS